MFALQCRQRAPYRYWSREEEEQVRLWIRAERTLTEISLELHRPRRAVREKLRRMGLKARKTPRGPCDCENCTCGAECLRAIKLFQALPKPECEQAWPSRKQ